MINRHVNRAALAAAVLMVPAVASAQYIMVPDSNADKIMLFSKVDGSLVNANFILDAAGPTYDWQTPKEAFQVGNEIWVTDQVSDNIARFTASLTPTHIGTITGPFDNMRGGGVVGGRVFVSNAGTANGAIGDSFHVISTNGTFVSSHALISDPFDCHEFNGRVLVSDSVGHHLSIHELDGTFHSRLVDATAAGSQRFPQQITMGPTGPAGAREVWCAAFTSNAVYRYTDAGVLVASYPVSGPRGVALLDNGNVMTTNGTGVYVFTPATPTLSQVQAAGAQYASPLNLAPAACNAADIATAGSGNPQAGPDGFLTGDDFDLFIQAFFGELRRTSDNSLIADLVDGDGNPPPDGFLTGSDFDYFIAKFFEGC